MKKEKPTKTQKKIVKAWCVVEGKDLWRPFIGDGMVWRTKKEAIEFLENIKFMPDHRIVKCQIILNPIRKR